MEPCEAAKNRSDSPAVILVVRGELLDDTENGYLRAIGSDPDSGDQLRAEGSQLANERCSRLFEFRYGGITVSGCVGVGLWPQADIDRFKNRPVLAEDASDAQTVEIGVAIQRVPQMLEKVRLVVLGLAQQRFAREAGEGATQEYGHLGQLTKQTRVEVVLHTGWHQPGTAAHM
jgi:hypothetical protein